MGHPDDPPDPGWHAYHTSQLIPWITVRPARAFAGYVGHLRLTILREGQQIPHYNLLQCGETAAEVCTLIVDRVNRMRLRGVELVSLGVAEDHPPVPGQPR